MRKVSPGRSYLSCDVRAELAFQDSERKHLRWGSESMQRSWGGNEDKTSTKRF